MTLPMNLRGYQPTDDVISVQKAIVRMLDPKVKISPFSMDFGWAFDRILGAVSHYRQLAPLYGLPWDFVLCQAIHETNYARSIVCTVDHNWAGIKMPAGGLRPGLYRQYASDLEGIRDHCQLLAVYSGVWVPDMVDPTRNWRIPAILATKLGKLRCDTTQDLNGTWAVPGTSYAQNIEKTRVKLFTV